MSFPLHCRACKAWIGESREPIKWVGTVEDAQDRVIVTGPRDSWRCKGCGCTNIFRPYTEAEVSRKMVELKKSA